MAVGIDGGRRSFSASPRQLQLFNGDVTSDLPEDLPGVVTFAVYALFLVQLLGFPLFSLLPIGTFLVRRQTHFFEGFGVSRSNIFRLLPPKGRVEAFPHGSRQSKEQVLRAISNVNFAQVCLLPPFLHFGAQPLDVQAAVVYPSTQLTLFAACPAYFAQLLLRPTCTRGAMGYYVLLRPFSPLQRGSEHRHHSER